MAAVVPHLPPIPAVSAVLNGAPISARDHLDFCALTNHILGRGAQVVPAYSPNASISAGSTKTFAFRYIPRYACIQRLWCVVASSAHASAYGEVDLAAPSGGSFTAFPGRTAVTRDAATAVLYIEDLSAQGSSEVTASLDVKAVSRDLVVNMISCVEVPRSTLATDANERGIELTTLDPGGPIVGGANGRSLGGGIEAVDAAIGIVKRASLVQWAVDATTTDARAFTSGSWTDLWVLPHRVLGAKLYRADTTATVSFRVYAWASDATTSADVQVNTTSGGAGVASFSIPAAAGSTTPQWWPATTGAAGSFAVDCEDLTVADGRRSARFDDILVQVKRTAGAGTIYLARASFFT